MSCLYTQLHALLHKYLNAFNGYWGESKNENTEGNPACYFPLSVQFDSGIDHGRVTIADEKHKNSKYYPWHIIKAHKEQDRDHAF